MATQQPNDKAHIVILTLTEDGLVELTPKVEVPRSLTIPVDGLNISLKNFNKYTCCNSHNCNIPGHHNWNLQPVWIRTSDQERLKQLELEWMREGEEIHDVLIQIGLQSYKPNRKRTVPSNKVAILHKLMLRESSTKAIRSHPLAQRTSELEAYREILALGLANYDRINKKGNRSHVYTRNK